MSMVVVRSPTRVDLAGGTLDLWPLFNFVGGATTVNVAIDIYTRAEITPSGDSSIELISEDLQLKKKYKNLQEALADTDRKMDLLRTQLQFWKPQKGFCLKTSSESPVGGGLGGSSSLTISILKAFNEFTSGDLTETSQLVQVAHNIEAQVLNTPTGTQDYFPAASGGVNILHYSPTGIRQEVLDPETSVLAENFMLVYTGRAHHSGLNNFEVLTKAVQKDPQTVGALFDLKTIAEETAEVCRRAAWDRLPGLFQREFKARVRLAPAFSSPEIEKLAEVTLQAGAGAVKICGAGGGGCVLVWVEPAKREKVRSACQTAGFQVMDAKPVGKIPQKN